ncbi:MAG TPA: amino acid adenylation domain-containing protein, partial [Terriglobales bacterium]
MEGRPVQIVATSLQVPLILVDLSKMRDPAKEAQVAAAEEARTPLDLKNGPLLRTKLLRLGPADHVLLVTTHHIVFDGWSRRILVSDLAALYSAFCAGQASPLPDIPLQYADYAVWQRNHLQGENLGKLLEYWKRQLADAPATLDLPTDRPRPAVQSFRGAVRTFAFPKALSSGVAITSRWFGVTPFMTLMAGFQALLSRYSGQNDIVVGVPIANRNRAEVEGLIGFFANTLTLRTSLAADPTFRELLERVKDTALGAYAHQDMPFERLVEELRPERSLSYNPLFQVLFSLQNASKRAFELSGLQLQPLGGVAGTTAKFDLSFFLQEDAAGLTGRIEYNTDLFDSATIDRMLRHYQVLLEGAFADPDVRISRLPLLTNEERQQVLTEWNATRMEYPSEVCLHELFEQQTDRAPNAVACVFEKEQFTYRELNERANQLAHYLKQRGVGTGQRVGIFVERSLAMMVGLLGIQKTGAAYVPLDPYYPAERLRLVLDDARVPVLLTQQSLLPSMPEHAAEVTCLDSDWPQIAQESTSNLQGATNPEDLVYVIYTSGSTGRPKGVQVPHRAVVNLLSCMAHELRMGSEDVFPALASFAFDMCIPELYLPLVTGGRVVLARREMASNGEELAKLLLETGATIVHATPTTWSLLLEAGFTGRGLKRAIGAEPLPRELCTRLLEADNSLYNFYGPTETTVWSAFHHFRSADEPVVLGRPLANTQIYILDKNLQPVPAGVPGEIHIAGDGVTCGYLNLPELTAEKFLLDPFSHKPNPRMYKTGDMGRFLPDGRIEFLGRIDNQVKIRGFRIELSEI